MIGLVTATAAGRTAAETPRDQLARHAHATRSPTSPTPGASATRSSASWPSGATVRLIAPLLGRQDRPTRPWCASTRPGASRYRVVGGHHGGPTHSPSASPKPSAPTAVVTTATDAAGIPGLDTLGWAYEGDVAAVSRALLDGEPVPLWHGRRAGLAAAGAAQCSRSTALPEAGPAILVTDRTDLRLPAPSVVLRPPSLTIGVGASRGVACGRGARPDPQGTLADADLSPASIHELATVDAKADETGLLEAAETLGVPLTTSPRRGPRAAVDGAESQRGRPRRRRHPERRRGRCPHRRPANCSSPSARARWPRSRSAARQRRADGSPSSASAPAIATCSPLRRARELRRASVVVGLDQYVTQVADLLRPGTRVLATGLGAEQERAESAVELARSGHAVALIGSGDAGIYAMASPALEAADESFDVVAAPGVTAMLAAAALLGAPLGHDHAAISLSDLHTPWEIIERRVTAAAEGDFVVAFYNPRSRGREWQLAKSLAILAAHRPPGTPVGIVSDATRPGQAVVLTTLADVDPTTVGMTSLVIVGAASSRVVAGRFVTPRGYTWRQ